MHGVVCHLTTRLHRISPWHSPAAALPLASHRWCHSAPSAPYVRWLPCSVKYRVWRSAAIPTVHAATHTPWNPPQGAPSPGTEPSTCYDPALAALLHASPIASRWRRRRILARRNLIRQAAPPGPSAKRVPQRASQPNKKAAARRRPPSASALLPSALLLFPASHPFVPPPPNVLQYLLLLLLPH